MSFFKANPVRAAIMALMLLGAVALAPAAAMAGGGDSKGENGHSTYKDGKGHTQDGQSVEGGDQYADQSNSASVAQDQSNKNWSLGPVFDFGQRSDACGCDYKNSKGKGKSHGGADGASTRNVQAGFNYADADVDQDNDADQEQTARQESASAPSKYGAWKHGSGDQSVKGGDQDASQTNETTVEQDQSNKNIGINPAIALGGLFGGGCGCESKGGYSGHGGDDGASTDNVQFGANHADADLDQENDADQTQTARQDSTSGGYAGSYKSGGADQEVKGGNQGVDQANTADVSHDQANKNGNISPALSLFGDAETSNYQKGYNDAETDVDQDNDADQTQTARQDSTSGGYAGSHKSGGATDQMAKGGDQYATQHNTAEVNHDQANTNINISPAISLFGDAETSNYQKGYNSADAEVDQENDADQSQAANQSSTSTGGGADQTVTGGNQDATQDNTAEVNQDQANKNINISPAISLFGDAGTSNHQSGYNSASADVDQENDADQSQTANQSSLVGSLLGN